MKSIEIKTNVEDYTLDKPTTYGALTRMMSKSLKNVLYATDIQSWQRIQYETN